MYIVRRWTFRVTRHVLAPNPEAFVVESVIPAVEGSLCADANQGCFITLNTVKKYRAEPYNRPHLVFQ